MAPLRCAHGSCSARFFVQLAKRRYATAAAAPTAMASCFDFLAPRTVASPPRMTHGTTRPLARRSAAPPATPATIPRRAFSSSAARSATLCVQNPVKDEDGNDMTLEITTRAAKVRPLSLPRLHPLPEKLPVRCKAAQNQGSL
ncbi:hypothetical protein IF2G_06381 [Cordyceps javanica]|nr:hypothetical protein IF2G_06381 [Cordyceps javanica]